LTIDASPTASSPELPPARWGAFNHRAFAVIWCACMVSNVGIAMFDTASGWFMTNFSADPMMVSLVQVATSLPLFLFTLPAGAFTDLVDPRRLLIGVEIGVAVVAALFAASVSLGLATTNILLIATFILGIGGALCAPAWVSIAPLLVPRRDLDGAVAANTVGYNLSRALGPALGGLAIAGFGVAMPFWIYAASNIVVLGALLWWRQPSRTSDTLPAERLTSALRTGLRHARNNPYLFETLVRTLAFFPFASAYWALLPLIARKQMDQGAEFYGLLLGSIGVGAIAGSLALNSLKAKLGPDYLVALASLGTALALVLFGLAQNAETAVAACFIAGVTWTLTLASLYVSAQVALPNWVRGRGLAIFLTIIFGASTVGSAVWGKIAGLEGLSSAQFLAAGGVLLAIPLTWRFKLQTGLGVDLYPSMHWPTPRVAQEIELKQGPVLVTVEYRINPKDRFAFLAAIEEVGRERKRDGAYAWGVFENIGAEGSFLEAFLIETWLELMHQHERVTNADRLLEDQVRGLLLASPRVSHLIAPKRIRRSRIHRLRTAAQSM
jgi:predicted MFS family arabinose efflux permease